MPGVKSMSQAPVGPSSTRPMASSATATLSGLQWLVSQGKPFRFQAATTGRPLISRASQFR